VLQFSQQTTACDVIFLIEVQAMFIHIFPKLHFIIIIVRIITVSLSNFYIYVIKNFRRYSAFRRSNYVFKL
jgi:hypothetical protein